MIMNHTHRNFIAISCAALSLFAACTKPVKKPTTSCTPTLYGYASLPATLFDTVSSRTYGIINPATVTSGTIGTFNTSTYSNQAAFNSSDNCYYAFKTHMGSGAGTTTLYKTDLSGAVNTLPGAAATYYGLTYNKVTNKLYCLYNTGTTTTLSEVNILGSAFSATTVATPVHPFFDPYFGANTTVDDNTGAVYYTTGDTSTTYIEKYMPGVSGSVVTATCTGGRYLLGLRFNKSDNMLYAIKAYPTGSPINFDFIKINPATGAIATMAVLPFAVNPEFYSATIDPCNNKYIISTIGGGTTMTSSFVNQLDMAGTIVQHDTTTRFYQGLYINY
jgi:hypothetical protein